MVLEHFKWAPPEVGRPERSQHYQRALSLQPEQGAKNKGATCRPWWARWKEVYVLSVLNCTNGTATYDASESFTDMPFIVPSVSEIQTDLALLSVLHYPLVSEPHFRMASQLPQKTVSILN